MKKKVLNIYGAVFDAEKFWENEQVLKLPFFPDKQSEKIVEAMDELLFPLCKKEDILLTQRKMNNVHFNYLEWLGFEFKNIELNNVDKSNLNNIEQGEEKSQFFCYAAIPSLYYMCLKNEWQWNYPSLDIIKRVNSKRYSTIIKNELEIKNYGVCISDLKKLQNIGIEMLEKSPIIIKEEYGVSGRGNLPIGSEAQFKNIINYFRKKDGEISFVLEPLLDKIIDIACQIFISATGKIKILSVEKIINDGFSYQGTITIDQVTLNILKSNNYFNIIESVCRRLYADGYFGNVCIDSMILKKGEIVPVVEINARMSMSYIKRSLDQWFLPFQGCTMLSNEIIVMCRKFEYIELLKLFDNNKLLYKTDRMKGIILLSANTVICNRQYEGNYKGKLYYYIIGDTEETVLKIKNRVRECLQKFSCAFNIKGSEL